jgi:hypothetical protein
MPWIASSVGTDLRILCGLKQSSESVPPLTNQSQVRILLGSPGGEPYSATLVSHSALEVGLRPDQSFAWSEKKAPEMSLGYLPASRGGLKVASKDLEKARIC